MNTRGGGETELPENNPLAHLFHKNFLKKPATQDSGNIDCFQVIFWLVRREIMS